MKLPEELVSLLSDPDTPNSVLQDLLTDLEGKVDVAQVFIVVGCTGEYSGYREWYVGAFLDSGNALRLADHCNEWLHENGGHADDAKRWNEFTHAQRVEMIRNRMQLKNKNPYDPNCDIDDAYGAEYKVVTVPLRG